MDLDGVIWLAGRPIPGSSEAVKRLRERGVRVLFVTNNSSQTTHELLEHLLDVGIDSDESDVMSSARVAASMLDYGGTALVCGGNGVREALHDRGISVVTEPPSDTVLVGWTREFSFDILAAASDAARRGARLIGTNDDATYPTPDGLLPGAGAILAAVATAAQRPYEVAGKPNQPTVDMLSQAATDIEMVVGDRPSTDGVLAKRLGVPYSLVRSGVTRDSREPFAVEPDLDAPNLASLVDRLSGAT